MKNKLQGTRKEKKLDNSPRRNRSSISHNGAPKKWILRHSDVTDLSAAKLCNDHKLVNVKEEQNGSQNEVKPPMDPWSDPANPRVISYQDVSLAAYRTRSGIIRTACTKSNLLSEQMGMEIYFKKDFLQITGSFKERGARNALMQLNNEQKSKGVIAASAGNHALAISYHGKLLNIPVTVVMPMTAPMMKVSLCRQYGARIISSGADIGESKELALRMAEEEGLLYINGYDHPHVIAGQGTMGLEILEQVENVDALVVPVGGAGLIAGLAVALKHLSPETKIIGVEATACPSFSKALETGKPTYAKPGSTTADGLSVPIVGVNAFETAKSLVDKVVCVSEEFITLAILRLIEMEKAVVEGAGATGLAALLSGHLLELRGKRVIIPLCGGNIDTTVLGRVIERGLALDRRLIRFSVTVSDRPGGICQLAELLYKAGASIKDIMHERAWVKADTFSVNVKLVVETRDDEHATQIEKMLTDRYERAIFNPLI